MRTCVRCPCSSSKFKPGVALWGGWEDRPQDVPRPEEDRKDRRSLRSLAREGERIQRRVFFRMLHHAAHVEHMEGGQVTYARVTHMLSIRSLLARPLVFRWVERKHEWGRFRFFAWTFSAQEGSSPCRGSRHEPKYPFDWPKPSKELM